MRTDHLDIRIGTIAPADRCPDYLKAILPHGFECFQLTLSSHLNGRNLQELGERCVEALQGKATISALGLYGNPLQDDQTAQDWIEVIKGAKHFGCSVICGFAGALEDRPVDHSIPKFKDVFTPIAKAAEDEGVKIGFENCEMGGTWQSPRWNIAHSPRAWEMMFDAVPSDALGLEWEPCHQMVSLIDPLPQLRKWVGKVVHVHGKDATIARDVLKERGLRSGDQWVWHRTPGFGDTNWTDIISILRKAGFQGAIDIEGWHDPVYRDDLEMTGQVRAMKYLMDCRGGAFIANPPGS